MALDSRLRSMSLSTLQALRLSILTQLKAVEGTGQTHSASGRQTALADFEKLTNRLADIESAIEWKSNPANAGNNGFASRYQNFNVPDSGC